MDVLVALGLFILSVGACLLLDWSILYGLLVGLAAFLLLAHGHGQPWRALPGLVWQGVRTALPVVGVVLLSNAYSGLFRAAHLLGGLERRLSGLADRVGLFPTQLLTALLTGGVFCNQAIGTVLGAQLLSGVYQRKGASNLELAVDIGSSIMTLAGLIPWSVASAVPLAMLGASTGALGFAVYLYAVPLCYLATRSHWFPGSSRPGMEWKQKGADPGCDW